MGKISARNELRGWRQRRGSTRRSKRVSCGRVSKKKPEQRKYRDVPLKELAAIVERTRTSPLAAEDVSKLKTAMETLVFLTEELQAKGTTIDRLRRLLFGPTSEKTSNILKEARTGSKGAADGEPKAKSPGHGRNGAAAYWGANRERVSHASLNGGDRCQGCLTGKVYPVKEPVALVRITGLAPLGATVWECERLRCNLCGEVYTADAPGHVGKAKYDETAVAMTGLLRYGTGLPFTRIEKLQAGMGIPLPAATQWELVEGAAEKLAPLFEELTDHAAQGELFHNDDTTMKVLDLTKEQLQAAGAGQSENRTGVFTSSIISMNGGHAIALFFTGRQHAGENLADVLQWRSTKLNKPLQMCDALPANTSGEFKTIVANCMAHARRGFVDVVNAFPGECERVLETLRDVYRIDALAKEKNLSALERLTLHQAQSGPLMKKLEDWFREQLDGHLVEPNSGLGEAIVYMTKHWPKLTLFLREAGAPLDNNIAERALKKAILHRRNSLFYKTLNGARVGDTFMSLIHSAELNDVAPFDYLVALLRHHKNVADNPAAWMPWNYQQALDRADSVAGA